MSVCEALIRRAQAGDRQASEQLVTENSGLIWAVTRRFLGRGVEAEDLYQLGCIGFLKALEGFDPAFGTQFSTYAVPKIAGEIRRFLRDDGPVKVGRTMREKGQSVWSARERLRGALGREPLLSELARELQLPPEEVAAIELANIAPESLQRETAEGFTLESTLAAEPQELPLLEKLSLRSAIEALPEREKLTIVLRYYRGMTQQQAARILGVSQVQVSRLERRAITALREALRE